VALLFFILSCDEPTAGQFLSFVTPLFRIGQIGTRIRRVFVPEILERPALCLIDERVENYCFAISKGHVQNAAFALFCVAYEMDGFGILRERLTLCFHCLGYLLARGESQAVEQFFGERRARVFDFLWINRASGVVARKRYARLKKDKVTTQVLAD
jgi:hypothetical protein